MTRFLHFFILAALIVISARTAHADPAPGDGCATNNQVMHSGGPENSGNAYWMVCQGGTWRQIITSDANGMASTNTPTAANHIATKAYVDSMASGGTPTQVFTSNGTFVVPAGVSHVKIIVVGGGGAGGPANNLNPATYYGTSACSGSGGNAGAKAQTASFPVTAGASIPVTVGAGGAGSAPLLNNTTQYQTGVPARGNSGQPSSFGTYIVSAGGLGGIVGSGYYDTGGGVYSCYYNAGQSFPVNTGVAAGYTSTEGRQGLNGASGSYNLHGGAARRV